MEKIWISKWVIYKLTLTKVSILCLCPKSHIITTVMVAFLNTYLSFKYTVQSLTYCSFYSQLYNLIFKENNEKTITIFLFTLFTLRNVVTKWLRSIHPMSNWTARFSNFEEASAGRVWQNRWYSRWQGWNDVYHGPIMAEKELERSCTSRVLSTCKSDF